MTSRRNMFSDGRSDDGALRSLLLSDRGATLVFAAVFVGVGIGCAAIAVDLGMLATARVQSQRAADSGALAGAGELALPGTSPAEARAEARSFANRHNVLNMSVNVQDADVDVMESEGKVRVRVHHSVPTLFARILGIWDANVTTVATAQAVPAGRAECPIPIVAVDGWTDDDGDGLYDSGEPYTSCEHGEPCTGYSEDDVGMVMEIKSQNTSTGESATQTCGAANPEWYCWIDDAPGKGSVGVQELRDLFFNDCAETGFSVSVGDLVEASPGNKMSMVRSIADYITANGGSSLRWDDSDDCVSDASGCLASHPLIRTMPIVEPTSIGGSGEGAHATVNSLVRVWLEKVAASYDEPHASGPPGQWNLYVRLMSGPGGIGGGGHPDALLTSIVLIE